MRDGFVACIHALLIESYLAVSMQSPFTKKDGHMLGLLTMAIPQKSSTVLTSHGIWPSNVLPEVKQKDIFGEVITVAG